MSRILLLVPAVLLAVGCASQEGGETAADAPEQPAAAAPATAETAAAEAVVATVTGTMGCGQCMFKTTSECSAALQTSEGVVWILEDVAKDSPLFADRMEGYEIRVTGTKRAEAGSHYLAVQSFERVGDEAGSEEG